MVVQQINNLKIKHKVLDNEYQVWTLDGRHLETFVSLYEAQMFCTDTRDFVVKG